MAKIKTLVQGYADRKTGRASSSCVLIRENKLNIIVDPGMDRKKLLVGLEKENLKPSDIDFVVITHTHLDHFGLAGIFENAKIFDRDSINSFDGNIVDHDGKIPGTDVKIMKTPGHGSFHCSILANSNKEKIIVAGDVIWWWDSEKQKNDYDSIIKRHDPYEKDYKKLIESRKKVLKLADWIIPGHGKIFASKNLKS